MQELLHVVIITSHLLSAEIVSVKFLKLVHRVLAPYVGVRRSNPLGFDQKLEHRSRLFFLQALGIQKLKSRGPKKKILKTYAQIPCTLKIISATLTRVQSLEKIFYFIYSRYVYAPVRQLFISILLMFQ